MSETKSLKAEAYRSSAKEGREAVEGCASDLDDVVLEMADDLDAAAGEIERLEGQLAVAEGVIAGLRMQTAVRREPNWGGQ